MVFISASGRMTNMKNSKLFLLIPLLMVSPLVGCNHSKNNDPIYDDAILYNDPDYEPVDFSREDAVPYSITVLGIPSEGIKQTLWDEYDSIEFRVYYQSDKADTPLVIDHKFYEKNIPVEYRHYLGEIGTHKIEIKYGLMPLSFEFKVIENPDWHGYKCEYFDKDGKYLHTQQVGYYADVIYNGPELVDEEDEDYQYHFKRWNHNTKCIHQDMQFKAVYQKNEKRLVSVKPRLNNFDAIAGLVSNNNPNKGQALIYLGRIKRATLLHSDAKELFDKDIELSFENGDYSKYWNELNNSVISKIKYEHDPNYDSYMYGSVSNLISQSDFASYFDERYSFGDINVVLENGEKVKISHSAPYDTCLSTVKGYMYNHKTITKQDYVDGYYRLAVVAAVDVYLSVSITRIDADKYEVGNFNNFLASPVSDTVNYLVQYSEEEEFTAFDDSYLSLSNKAVYETAKIIKWNKWAN